MTLAFRVLLGSLTMIFAATLVAYWVIRVQNDVWRTADMPPLPWGLVGTTILLAGVSGALETALARIRRNELGRARLALSIAALCAVAFLVGQGLNWRGMLLPTGASVTLYPFTFFMLTGTHAAHVVGGMASLAVVQWKAWQDEYSSSRHHGVVLCAHYWHYLGTIWVVLLLALWFGS